MNRHLSNYGLSVESFCPKGQVSKCLSVREGLGTVGYVNMGTFEIIQCEHSSVCPQSKEGKDQNHAILSFCSFLLGYVNQYQ